MICLIRLGCKENLQGMTMEVALEDNNLMEKVLPPDEQVLSSSTLIVCGFQ